MLEAGFEDMKYMLKPHGETIPEHTAELADHDKQLSRVERNLGLRGNDFGSGN